MLQPGKPERLSPLVRRLVAPNPGPMTGPGTNTYLLGHDEVVVVDPGPALPQHIEAILQEGGEHIRHVVCTHTHPDHSPAWQAVAACSGAQVYGAVIDDDGHQDRSFAPDVQLRDGFRLQTSELCLRAIHTPGHVSNHFCLLLEEEGMVFAGDHIMQGSTVVIIPPAGNMADYIQSLERLLEHPIETIAPGHGTLIRDSRHEIERLVRHRLLREAKVLSALQAIGPCTPETLVCKVYDDVDPALHRWALLSQSAHLIKLRDEARAAHDPQTNEWRALTA
jgi:glyoxylase-like metal-dependent hydrolase (beta-lactamase superfamily II)